MRRRYKNPPIIESICEIRFTPSQPWDWTIPGLIYDRVKQDYPVKRQKEQVHLEVSPEKQELSQKNIARLQFFREDKLGLIQVGPNVLTVNHLKPYPGWENFKPMIFSALQIYNEIAKPKGPSRLGLRYINRIETNQKHVNNNDYLRTVPLIPDEIPNIFSTWVQRLEIPFEQANGLLLLQTGSLDSKGKQEVDFLLDLDFITLDISVVSLDTTMDWIEEAHNEVERTFEACITDSSRNLFEEVRSNE